MSVTIENRTLLAYRADNFTHSITTHQFLQPEPITHGNTNPYTYPTDPINHTDMNGMFDWENAWKLALACHMSGTACPAIGSVTFLIKSYIARTYPGAKHSREANAKRHFIWQFTLTVMFGYRNAKIWGDLHELGDTNITDSVVDQKNNSVARKYGLLVSLIPSIQNSFAVVMTLAIQGANQLYDAHELYCAHGKKVRKC